MSWYADYQARRAAQTVNSVNSVNTPPDADEAAERAAIQAEGTLPPLGTPERARLDLAQRVAVAGLLAVGDSQRWQRGRARAAVTATTTAATGAIAPRHE